MVHKLLNLFLAIVILSCPLRCQLGLSGCCVGAAGETQSSTIECCCDTQNDSSPCPLHELPCKKRGCICSGATIPDHFEIDWTIQWLPVCELVQPVAILPQFLLASESRPPDHRAGLSPANIGRAIRCLHSSLII